MALRGLGGRATTRQIAIATGLNTNGVSQSLGALANAGLVTCLGGRGAECEWEEKEESQEKQISLCLARLSRGWTHPCR